MKMETNTTDTKTEEAAKNRSLQAYMVAADAVMAGIFTGEGGVIEFAPITRTGEPYFCSLYTVTQVEKINEANRLSLEVVRTAAPLLFVNAETTAEEILKKGNLERGLDEQYTEPALLSFIQSVLTQTKKAWEDIRSIAGVLIRSDEATEDILDFSVCRAKESVI